jgi:hypothetical protein
MFKRSFGMNRGLKLLMECEESREEGVRFSDVLRGNFSKIQFLSSKIMIY